MSNSRRLTIGQNIDSGESGGGSISTSNYMTILALEDGLQAKLSGNIISYSLDEGNTWTSLDTGTYTPSVNKGQTIMFKGNLTSGWLGIGTFTISKKCNLDGNCMSLLFGDDTANNNSLSGKDYAFHMLFSDCTTIIQVSESFLPATTLASDCYSYMFYGCTSLTVAPELPATTLGVGCYQNMFYNCTSLTTAPELPATTLASYCYSYMFYGCSSLTTGPSVLPATTLAKYCYQSMFRGCSGLTSAPELPATKLANGCYNSMFYGCTSLTASPELPATKLANGCYNSMFYGCTSLTASPELPATTLDSYCYQSMFRGCTSLTNAPELPATTLADYCYEYMFYGCSKLNYIKMLATDISATDCLYYWVYNVSPTGTFVKHPTMTSLPTGASGIPSGWTVVDDN